MSLQLSYPILGKFYVLRFADTEDQGRNKKVVPALCSMYKRQFHRVKEYC